MGKCGSQGSGFGDRGVGDTFSYSSGLFKNHFEQWTGAKLLTSE